MFKHLPSLLQSHSAQCFGPVVFAVLPALRIGEHHANTGSPAPLLRARFGFVRVFRAFAARPNISFKPTRLRRAA